MLAQFGLVISADYPNRAADLQNYRRIDGIGAGPLAST